MRRVAMRCLFVLVTVAMVFAQAPAGAGSQQSQPPSTDLKQGTSAAAAIDRVDAGAEVHAALDTPLSTRTSRPGDRFTATITDPVRGSNGAVVVPIGARVEGEIAEAEESRTLAALRSKGALSLRFRNVVLPDGQTLPLTATLVSVRDTRGKSTVKADPGGQMQSSTGGIAAGGGTAGLVFGPPVKGLAIATLAGGGYVLSTKGKDVNLPAQTGMVMRLDQPISALGTSVPQQR